MSLGILSGEILSSGSLGFSSALKLTVCYLSNLLSLAGSVWFATKFTNLPIFWANDKDQKWFIYSQIKRNQEILKWGAPTPLWNTAQSLGWGQVEIWYSGYGLPGFKLWLLSDSRFLPEWLLRSSRWFSHTENEGAGSLDGISAFWSWPGQIQINASIWGVSQRMEDIFPFALQINKIQTKM